jgi:hypothetical protein
MSHNNDVTVPSDDKIFYQLTEENVKFLRRTIRTAFTEYTLYVNGILTCLASLRAHGERGPSLNELKLQLDLFSDDQVQTIEDWLDELLIEVPDYTEHNLTTNIQGEL